MVPGCLIPPALKGGSDDQRVPFRASTGEEAPWTDSNDLRVLPCFAQLQVYKVYPLLAVVEDLNMMFQDVSSNVTNHANV